MKRYVLRCFEILISNVVANLTMFSLTHLDEVYITLHHDIHLKQMSNA